jgi:hypothetical protein
MPGAKSNPGGSKMSKTKSILASLMMAGVILSQNVLPVYAANPSFDITGVWKFGNGDTFQVFQENDEVNGIFVGRGFAHRWSGRYISPTKIKLVQIRRTRPNSCEVTMEIEVNVTSANSITTISTATEAGCGISVGQIFTGTYSRLL